MNAQISDRLIGLDLVKVLACFLVVALHTCTKSPSISLSSILYYLGVIAIPLFFITHGYLLFGKTRNNKWYSYKKIGRILFLTFILNVLLMILDAFFMNSFFNPLIGSVDSLFLQRGRFSHFWFLGALIFIYLLFPILDYLYMHKQKLFVCLFVCLFVMQMTVDIINIYSSVVYSKLFQAYIPQTFRFESHFSYFVLGGMIKLNRFRIQKYITLLSIVACLLIILCYQFFMVRHVYPTLRCEYFYDNLLIIVSSAMIFVYLINKNFTKYANISKVISFMSGLIMIIYIIHPFVIILNNSLIGIGSDVISLVIVFGICTLFSWIISKIPYVNTIFKI